MSGVADSGKPTTCTESTAGQDRVRSQPLGRILARLREPKQLGTATEPSVFAPTVHGRLERAVTINRKVLDRFGQ